ncbi:MAG TPA: 16S rRNA (cytidine(1402)-2'-O)-methyltransferase [Ignavibacteriaceae bacterium]|nr:16S rRNA (cytidine(1402)-2'-O)-methyltransferase [Ignavibacteriaceae bacterium]
MLFVISTPIGNLKDITLRAIETLQEVDFVICEDTRVTSFLLNHYNIKKELVSFNAASEERKIEYVLSRLSNGEKAGLVSDAGTPAISDPGVRLISAAVRANIKVIPIPGVSAAICALSAAGLPSDAFVFEGFLPQKKGRQKKLQEFSVEKRTIILYESTYRIEKLLEELKTYMPERIISVCRELTKKFEEFLRGTPEEVIEKLSKSSSKGEFVVIISPINWKE